MVGIGSIPSRGVLRADSKLPNASKVASSGTGDAKGFDCRHYSCYCHYCCYSQQNRLLLMVSNSTHLCHQTTLDCKGYCLTKSKNEGFDGNFPFCWNTIKAFFCPPVSLFLKSWSLPPLLTTGRRVTSGLMRPLLPAVPRG